MDVHPPHEPVHTWRDALVHLGIVTVGLFIALSLEALVEFIHHRELVQEARENIRRELEVNHQALQHNEAALGHQIELSKADLNTLHYMRAHPDAKGQSISFVFSFESLSDSAWTTARDTGALGFMPYSEVQSDAAIYELQANVRQQETLLSTRQARILAPFYAQGDDSGKIPDSEWSNMLLDVATNQLDLTTLKQFMQALDQSYTDRTKKT